MLEIESKVIDENIQGTALASEVNAQADKKFYIESYGCAMNFNDSEIIASILHGVGYGATKDIEEANLIMIQDFRSRFGVISGLSDHTMGSVAPIVSTCLGGKIIEKHFILDRSMGGVDSSFSMDEREFTEMVKAVRDAVKEQNEQLKKEGKPLVPAEGLISMAQELLPKLRVAEWLDKAEAAKADIELLDLRDLRQVVVGADDPMVVRDESTRALATELKAALKTRQEFEQTRWLEDIKSALAVSRVIRALKISSEPPKAGQPFPADLGAQLAAAASASLSSETAPDRFSAVLEAVAFSPVRGQVKLAAVPPTPNEAMLSTVKV